MKTRVSLGAELLRPEALSPPLTQSFWHNVDAEETTKIWAPCESGRSCVPHVLLEEAE